jgi:hypothetical protein
MLFNHVHHWLQRKGIWAVTAIALIVLSWPGSVGAASGDFNVQVSPSPVVVTLTPGKQQTSTLTVRNLTNHPETLYPKLSGFEVDKTSKNVKLLDEVPLGVAEWVSFKSPSVTIAPGGTQTLEITYNPPKDAGFSYSVAITLSRDQNATIPQDGVQLRGAIAVFCLINIDRPDAKRALTIESFTGDKSSYQFLPATFTLTVKNTGNTISQPKGTLYIQRSFDSTKPIATYSLNTGNNYVLPGTSREFKNEWNSGFPLYVKDKDGKRHVSWDWKHLSDLRFGKYTAKVVMVYNDGKRDVPVITSYSFWVIPWTLILILLIIAVILGMGIFGWARLIMHGTKKVRSYAHRR